jgi:acetyl esterase/lipase
MTAQQRDLVHQILRTASFDLGGDALEQRPKLDHMLTAAPLPKDVLTVETRLGDVPAVLVEIEGVRSRGVLLHLHGGGFALGSAAGSVGLVSDLIRRTGLRAATIDYRLAPEAPFPAALDDAIAAYEALVTEAGAERLIISGESAGGNLAVELLIAARTRGLPQPAAAVLMSPMTDLTANGDSFSGKAGVDPNITARAIRTRAAEYAGDMDLTDPRLSPIFADLAGLPPLLIQAGSHEVLLDDATRLAAKAAADDVAVILDVTPGVPHVFQAFAAILDEGDAALNRASEFIVRHLG